MQYIPHIPQKGEQDRLNKLQQEMIDAQVRYQREIERLEKDNRELKKQLLLKDQRNGKKRKMKVRITGIAVKFDARYCVCCKKIVSL